MLLTTGFSHPSGVSRILDPTLCDRPIGITQKSLFATVSYEARALGLRKLQSIRSARDEIAALGGTIVKQGQHGRKKDGEGVELVLVDGEDLSAYRRASTAVAWIVEGIVGAASRKSGKRKRGEVSLALGPSRDVIERRDTTPNAENPSGARSTRLTLHSTKRA